MTPSCDGKYFKIEIVKPCSISRRDFLNSLPFRNCIYCLNNKAPLKIRKEKKKLYACKIIKGTLVKCQVKFRTRKQFVRNTVMIIGKYYASHNVKVSFLIAL